MSIWKGLDCLELASLEVRRIFERNFESIISPSLWPISNPSSLSLQVMSSESPLRIQKFGLSSVNVLSLQDWGVLWLVSPFVVVRTHKSVTSTSTFLLTKSRFKILNFFLLLFILLISASKLQVPRMMLSAIRDYLTNSEDNPITLPLAGEPGSRESFKSRREHKQWSRINLEKHVSPFEKVLWPWIEVSSVPPFPTCLSQLPSCPFTMLLPGIKLSHHRV